MTLNVTVCQKEKNKLHWITLPNGKKVPVHRGENFRPKLDNNTLHKIKMKKGSQYEFDVKNKLESATNEHHSNERKQFIKNWNNMSDEKKIRLLTAKDGGAVSKETATDFIKYSDGTTNDIVKDMIDGREILADISTKLGYDY